MQCPVSDISDLAMTFIANDLSMCCISENVSFVCNEVDCAELQSKVLIASITDISLRISLNVALSNRASNDFSGKID